MVAREEKLAIIEKRARNLAKLLLQRSQWLGTGKCPLEMFMEKNFAERVLMLEDCSTAQLEEMICACTSCGRCK